MRTFALLLIAAAAPALAETSAPSLAPTVSLMGAAINVADLQREVDFYTKGLGFSVGQTLQVSSGMSETILVSGGDMSQATIMLMHDTSSTAPKTVVHGKDFSRLVIRVSDLPAIAGKLTAQGYAHGEMRVSHGYSIMMLEDPEHFRIELVQLTAQPPRNP
jgi:catechol 2,3-dioxygenase-like lactoylglutathione lyase family enzyme